MTDRNPGVEGPGEQVDELELEPTTEEKTAQGGDPLDELTDPTVRAEAKKSRAIARRVAKKGKEGDEGPKVETPAPAASEFLTKADFEKANERKAILAAQADPEVKANWAEISQLVSSRRGRSTPEDIAEDIKDAITIFNARNKPAEDEDAGVRDLTATPVVKAGGGEGGSKKNDAAAKELPNFREAVQPGSWYPTKKKEGES